MTIRDTKERALPEHAAQSFEDYLIYLKHVAMYDFARAQLNDKFVLDLGCGEGYGASQLAQAARRVIAADADFGAVAHAARQYSDARLAFIVCDAQRLPFCTDTFDAVVSYEVIEHIPNVPSYLAEVDRVSNTSAKIFMSTPNRRLRLLPFQRPWNHFHLREYAAADFGAILQRFFARVDLLGVTAIEPIMQIEKLRVKQDPFIAYPRMFVRWLLPPRAYSKLTQLKSPALDESVQSAQREEYSAADFQIVPRGLPDCINLLALCETHR